MKRELLSRAYLVLFGLVLIAIVLIGKTAWISQVEGSPWRNAPDSTMLKVVDIDPERGNIYSSDDQLLATSVPYFDLHIDFASEAMTKTIFERELDSLVLCLHQHVFNESLTAIKRKLLKARKDGNRYFLIKRRATYAEYRHIKKFPLFRLGKFRGGLIVEQHSNRLKPFHALAFRTIGLDRGSAPSIGLEASFDHVLKGEKGKRIMQRLGNNVWVPMNNVSEIQPQKGHDIVSTLDMRIQDVAHHALQKALLNHAAESGLAVVMEVKTGKVRAMVNLRRQDDGKYWESFNMAVGSAVEPGSTFKLASMMALLEDHAVNLDDSINLHGGRLNFGRHTMRDAENHGKYTTSIRHSFEVSSNIGVAQLIEKYYGKTRRADQFIDRLKSFGLHQETGIEISGEGQPSFKEAYQKGWSKTTTLPWMSHGYEILITPLQMLTFYNAVANDGTIMKPYLVEAVLDGGKPIERFEPTVVRKQIASDATIAQAQDLLLGVVQNGTAQRLRRSHYSFAGKSGTSKLEYWKGENKYLASFIGYFPAEKPQYSCIVMVRDPQQRGYYGSTVAAPVFAEIADFCVATDKAFMQPAFASEDQFMPPVFQGGMTSDVTTVLDFLGMEYENETSSPYTVIMPMDSTLSMQNRLVKPNLVPNVTGMGLRDALYILENLGLDVKINGVGRVQRQSLEPGSRLDESKILLSLG